MNRYISRSISYNDMFVKFYQAYLYFIAQPTPPPPPPEDQSNRDKFVYIVTTYNVVTVRMETCFILVVIALLR